MNAQQAETVFIQKREGKTTQILPFCLTKCEGVDCVFKLILVYLCAFVVTIVDIMYGVTSLTLNGICFHMLMCIKKHPYKFILFVYLGSKEIYSIFKT